MRRVKCVEGLVVRTVDKQRPVRAASLCRICVIIDGDENEFGLAQGERGEHVLKLVCVCTVAMSATKAGLLSAPRKSSIMAVSGLRSTAFDAVRWEFSRYLHAKDSAQGERAHSLVVKPNNAVIEPLARLYKRKITCI